MSDAKIFIFCPALITGGLERVLSILSSPLSHQYREVKYVLWYEKSQFYQLDKRVKVISIEKECGSCGMYKKMNWLRQFVKKEKPNILISLSTPFNMISLFSLLGTGIRIIISERNDPAHFRWGRIAKIFRNILYLNADGILVQTESSKNNLWKPLLKRAVIIPNPLMIERDIIGVAFKSEKEHVIITASRFVPQKRIDLIIRVFGKFIKKHPNYKLFIYGEGPERVRLQLLVKELDLTSSVEMPGVVINLWEKMKVAEMFVMASEYEGMSNSLLEAMALGLPCISTKVSGAIDIIKNGKNGLLVDINDEKALLEAMVELAEQKDLRESLGKEACHIADDLSLMKVSSMWTSYIDSFILS